MEKSIKSFQEQNTYQSKYGMTTATEQIKIIRTNMTMFCIERKKFRIS